VKGRTAPGAARAREEIAAATERLETARESFAAARFPDALKEAVEARQLALRIASGSGALRHDAAIMEIGGRVEIQRASRATWETARVGMKLYEGDFLKTGANGLAEVMAIDGTFYRIKPETLFEVHRSRTLPGAGAGEPQRQSEIKFIVGTVDIRHGRGLALHREDRRGHRRHRIAIHRGRRRRPLPDDRRLRLPGPGHALHRVRLGHPRRTRARRGPRGRRRARPEGEAARPAPHARPGRRRRLRPEPQAAGHAEVDPREGGGALPPPDRAQPALHPRLDPARRRPPPPGGDHRGPGGREPSTGASPPSGRGPSSPSGPRRGASGSSGAAAPPAGPTPCRRSSTSRARR
jgi:hypothetical protein